MIAYLIRRLLYAVPTVLGILLLTFAMFFIFNSPRAMARKALGMKADDAAIDKWIQKRGYDLPLFYNDKAQGASKVTQTLLYQKCARVLVFDLGRSDANDRDIAGEIRRRMMPSLAIGVPTFVLGLLVEITLSLIVAFLRGTYLDRGATVLCVLMMSVSGLFYIIGGQFVFAQWLKLFPISGFDWGGSTVKFVFLPVLIGVVGGIGGSVRFGRTVMVEEVGKDYVRTARAKGLGESAVMFRHVLKNASIPILTGAVMSIPFLFMGSMLMESFFGIPGLGSMTINAINAWDFAVIRSMTFIGAVLYIIGLLMTDVSYTLVDPRITLGSGGSQSLQGQPSLKDVAAILVTLEVLCYAGYGIYKGYLYLSKVDFITNIGKRVPLGTNAGAAGVVLGLVGFLLYARRRVLWVNAWRQVRRDKMAMVSLAVVLVFLVVGLMDSVSWSDVERPAGNAPNAQAAMTPPRSILDRICAPLRSRPEKTYSAPLADTLVAKETVDKLVDGQPVIVDGQPVKERVYKPLDYPGTHLLGTDQTGNDVLYVTLKGVRTALIIGGLTTIIAVPFAILFGVVAGFFGGWVDDVITYIYTTLSCIPSVLLIACFMLIFGRGIVQLCIVMGITGWVGLCRLLRGETMKLREREYVQAATALGVSKYVILARHIVPNVMHLVLISIVLRFSGQVLSEAMLSYIGIGVGPDTFSWGTMINGARNELGRDPMVWWNLAASFVAMLALVLPANLFSDSLRDALDPSLRVRGAGDRG
jgi:ABC-type dipeptide/oligopeptide/nickel transport system permease subunit